MVINKFLERLQRVYPQYSKTEDYVEDVLTSLVSDDNIKEAISQLNDTVLRKMAKNTPNSIKNGKLPRKLAIKIVDNYEPIEFVRYIDTLKTKQKDILLELFDKEINDLSIDNMSKKLSCKLRNIIYEISIEKYDTSKRKSSIDDKLSSYDKIIQKKLTKKFIKELIDKISNIKPDEITNLRISSSSIKNKFKKNENSLKNNITPSIMMYFKYVDRLLAEKEKNSGINSDNIRIAVRNKFIELDKKKLSKSDIYKKMIAWLARLLDGDENSCQILLSYFVQSCEVFNVINKQNK